MSNLNEVFARIQANKAEQKTIKESYKDALSMNKEHHEITEELKTLKARKQQIEAAIKQEYHSEFTKLDDLKIDLNSDIELLSDLALNQLMKGETVEIVEDETRYEPVFNVRFRKA